MKRHAMGTSSKVIRATGLLLVLLAGVGRAQTRRMDSSRTAEVTRGIAVTLPAGWTVAERPRGALELARVSTARAGKLDARLTIATQVGRDPTDAMRHLADIALEYRRDRYHLTVIGGWPALERRRSAPLPQPGQRSEESGKRRASYRRHNAIKPQPEPGEAPRVTVAIAAGPNLLRFEATLSPLADPRIADEAGQIARGVRLDANGDPATAERALVSLELQIAHRRNAHPAPGKGPAPSPAGAGGSKEDGPPPDPAFVVNSLGEIEVAASPDGQTVVVAARGLSAFSTDGGASFAAGGGLCTYNNCDSDPSLAAGSSGTFYASWIGQHDDLTWTNSLSSSPDGKTWTFVADAVTSPAAPDQPHIAADHGPASANSDQIYLVNRVPRITCSATSGKSWSDQVALDPGGDFPRVAVGPDHAVYVVYVNGSNVMLDKFSACSASPALVRMLGFPYMVAEYVPVKCPVPGLDRCNGNNILSSPTVAVDDLDASHVFVAFATHTSDDGLGNDDVQVWVSQHGGQFGPQDQFVNANSAAPAPRFMPWLATYGGVAYVGWYDRRRATASQDDLTRYYLGSAAVSGGYLVSGAETDLSQVDDAQCASGWPCGTAEQANADACSTPQVAGSCRHNPVNSTDSFTACDFHAPVSGCPAGEQCSTSGVCPKFGDYNGVAASAGRIFNAWVSATPPPGITPASPGINVYASSTLVMPPPGQEPFLHKNFPGKLPKECASQQAEAMVHCRQTCGDSINSLQEKCQGCLRSAAVIFNDPRCRAPKSPP